MALTAMTFLAVFVSIECVRKRSWIYFVLCGIALGLAVAAKHSAFVVPPICLATMLASALMQRPRGKDYLRLVCGWLVACMLAFAILWAFYGFRYGALPHETNPAYDLMQPFADEGLEKHPRGTRGVIPWATPPAAGSLLGRSRRHCNLLIPAHVLFRTLLRAGLLVLLSCSARD